MTEYQKPPLGLTSISESFWVLPLSQWLTVHWVTPTCAATSFWRNLSVSRRFLMCSPRLRGSKSVSLGFAAFSRRGTDCKRATRPCPCGYRGMRNAECRCDDAAGSEYVGKLSGPLHDRIDLQIEIARVPFDDMVRREGALGNLRVNSPAKSACRSYNATRRCRTDREKSKNRDRYSRDNSHESVPHLRLPQSRRKPAFPTQSPGRAA